MTDECEDLRKAADLIREQHRADDPVHDFWCGIAHYFGHQAEAAQFSTIRGNLAWINFNQAVRSARAYLEAGGIVVPSQENASHGER